ncbi:hypothetical protein R6Q57_029256, partial [Mikania cordata]
LFVGNNQTSTKFWKRVRGQLISAMGRDSYWTNDMISDKFHDLQCKVAKFNGWREQRNGHERGIDDLCSRKHVIFSYRGVAGYEKINQMASRPEATNFETDEDVIVRK